MNKPLIIVSGLRPWETDGVLEWLKGVQRPMLLEGSSRLRGRASLEEFELRGGDKSIKHLDFDGVIRIGNVPTLRYWRDLETSKLPVHNFSGIPLSGLPREPKVLPLAALGEDAGPSNFARAEFEPWSANERARDRELAQIRERLIQEFPLSEPAWVNWLSKQIPRDARLLLGNSLPIREWDFAADAQATRDIFANRGTNGIDGLISTFAGVALESGAQNWAMIGDLSAMYDLSGPWALKQRPLKSFNLAVINNGGGQIFNRMFRNPLFLNEHGIRFDGWAGMWDMDYVRINEPRALGPEHGPRVIEILPEAGQTEAFMNAWEKV